MGTKVINGDLNVVGAIQQNGSSLGGGLKLYKHEIKITDYRTGLDCVITASGTTFSTSSNKGDVIIISTDSTPITSWPNAKYIYEKCVKVLFKPGGQAYSLFGEEYGVMISKTSTTEIGITVYGLYGAQLGTDTVTEL